MGGYWARVAKRAWRRSLELVRWESWERIVVFLIGIIIPFVAVWYFVGDGIGASVRALASFGGSALAVLAVFAWSLLRLPAIMDAEAAAKVAELESQRETAEAIKRKRVSLGQLLSQAEYIKRNCVEVQPVNEHMVTEWHDRARKFLVEEMGEEFLHRFQSDAGAPTNMLMGRMPERNREVWAWANRRAFRLNAILEAMPNQP